jgi:hypothetical protein
MLTSGAGLKNSKAFLPFQTELDYCLCKKLRFALALTIPR